MRRRGSWRPGRRPVSWSCSSARRARCGCGPARASALARARSRAVGDGGGFLGRPDVGDAQAGGWAPVSSLVTGARSTPFHMVRLPGGSRRSPVGAVVQPVQRGQPAGRRRRRTTGAQPVSARSGTTNRSPAASAAHSLLQVPEPGVDDADHAGRGQLADALERGREARRLVGRAGMRPVVDRHPGAGGGLQGLDLPADGAVGGPPLVHQRRAGVAAGEPDRGHVQVQPRRVRDSETGGRGQQQLAAHLLGHRGQRLQRPAEPVVVEQPRWDRKQFGDRRRGRPPGDVVQRRRASTAGWPPARRSPPRARPAPAPASGPPRPPSRPGPGPAGSAPPPAAARRGGGCRPAAGPAGPTRRPAAPVARRLQLIQAAQVCHNMLAHPAALAPCPRPAPGTRSCARRGGQSSPSDTCCHNTRTPGRAAARRHAGHKPANRP